MASPDSAERCTRRRGQSSIEFLMLVGFMMAVFTVFYAILSGSFADFTKQENAKIAYDLLDTVVAEIRIAGSVPDGYNRTFFLPAKLDGDTYIFTAVGGEYTPGQIVQPIEEIGVTFRDAHYARYVSTPAYLLAPLRAGEIAIVREGGVVLLSSR